MNTEERLEEGKALLVDWIKDTAAPEPNRLDVMMEPERLLDAVAALTEARWGYLSAITGLDAGWGYLSAIEGFSPMIETEEMEVLYHFCNRAAVLTLRVPVWREDPEIASICDIIPSATFYERELMEMFGITVKNTPDTSRLFLPDDWPAGVYPLRKDFDEKDLKDG